MTHKKLTGWLIYRRPDAARNQAYIQWMLEEAWKQNIDLKFLNREELFIGIRANQVEVLYQRQPIQKPDFAIVRVIDSVFTRHLEYWGVKTFNNSLVSEICNNKARTYQYLASDDIPMLESVFAHTSYLEALIPEVGLPVVVKSVGGRGGKEVFLVQELADWNMVLTHLPNKEIVIQRVAGMPGRDIRVFVIGKEIIAAVMRYSECDFRANFSLGGQAKLYSLSSDDKKLVNRIIERFEFGLVGIDFVLNRDGSLVFNEIEDVVGSRTLSITSDINLVEKYLMFIKGKIERGEW